MTKQKIVSDKQRRFIEEYIIDMNATKAAIRAGYSEKTASEQSCRLLTYEHIKIALQEKRAEIADKCDITVMDLIKELEEARGLAIDSMQSSAAVAATMGKAKMLGFLTDKVQHSGDAEKPVVFDVNISPADAYKKMIGK